MPNHLINEQSAYLKQHVNNPVDWYPWGKSAFDKAITENKLIFLSVGYSTCHWCHVMEHESFEDDTVAQMLNENFVSIKVDREEHPDVDKIYMEAVHAMNKRGGWPMSVFLTPDLKPFFGGTYFPKMNLLHILQQIKDAWIMQPDQITGSAHQLTEHLRAQVKFHDHEITQGKALVNALTKQALELFDPLYGGFGPAPKFPPSVKLMVLLRQYQSSQDPQVMKCITKTLDGMSYGGLYDHLGGGFTRYSTDNKWLVPHFEKMLYDNALLTRIYIETYQVTREEKYATIAKETLNYILHDMTDAEGGFYAAEDADSEGHEGLFYIFNFAELQKLLTTDELKLIQDVYGVTEAGNFEGSNILNLNSNLQWNIKDAAEVKSLHEKLFRYRDQRIRPLRDEKIITSWCALMIEAMAKAHQVFHDEIYLNAATKAANFIQTKHFNHGRLTRRSINGVCKHDGSLDDYAYLISALIQLYQCAFDERWLRFANELQAIQNTIFWDEAQGGYFFGNPGDEHLIAPIKEVHDEAIPNANAVACLNLQKLYHYGFDSKYKTMAEKILKISLHRMQHYPSAFAQMILALEFYFANPATLVIAEDKSSSMHSDLLKIWERFIPNALFAKASHTDSSIPVVKNKTMQNNKTTYYICHEGACQQPETLLNKVLEQMEN